MRESTTLPRDCGVNGDGSGRTVWFRIGLGATGG